MVNYMNTLIEKVLGVDTKTLTVCWVACDAVWCSATYHECSHRIATVGALYVQRLSKTVLQVFRLTTEILCLSHTALLHHRARGCG